MDRNKLARSVLKKNKAQFEKLTPQEEKAIEIQREELNMPDADKYSIIKKYLFSLISFARKKSEVNDIYHTIKHLQDLPENQGKANSDIFWKAPDQLISVQTMLERLHESNIGMRMTEVELHTVKRQVFEAFECTQDEIDTVYQKLMGNKPVEPKTATD